MRHGIAVAALANINRNVKRQPEPFKPADFIPWHASHRDVAERQRSPKVQTERLKAMLRVAGAAAASKNP